jgi:hypothetical protein
MLIGVMIIIGVNLCLVIDRGRTTVRDILMASREFMGTRYAQTESVLVLCGRVSGCRSRGDSCPSQMERMMRRAIKVTS